MGRFEYGTTQKCPICGYDEVIKIVFDEFETNGEKPKKRYLCYKCKSTFDQDMTVRTVQSPIGIADA